jgi:hypothetical protein
MRIFWRDKFGVSMNWREAKLGLLYFSVLWSSLLLLGCCVKKEPANPTEDIEVTTPHALEASLGDFSATEKSELSALRDKAASEGNKRGEAFCQLVLYLDRIRRMKSISFDRFSIFVLLGAPDYWKSNGRESEWVYLYDRFATKDWVIFVGFDSLGVVNVVAYNAASVTDLGRLPRYSQSPFQ